MATYITAPTYKKIVLPRTEEFGWHGDMFIPSQEVNKNRIEFVVRDMLRQDNEYRESLNK